MYSPISRFDGRDSIRPMLSPRWAKQPRASSRAPGWLECREKARLAIGPCDERGPRRSNRKRVQLPTTSLIG